MLTRLISHSLRSFDGVISRAWLAASGENSVLLAFAFHGLFESQQEINHEILDPQQGITVEMFRQFLEYFEQHDYQFVSVDDIQQGLKVGGRYLLLTFDDGYYNNLRALPILEEFNAPAVFFVSTGHVKSGKAYWWDVLYRERRKKSVSITRVRRSQTRCKILKTATVEDQLRAEFGSRALRPVCDLDRPFSIAELQKVANHPLVTIGNHTQDHAILTNYSQEEVAAQIQGAQDDLFEWTGRSSNCIAYPNGNCSPEIEKTALRAGLQLGVLAIEGSNPVSLVPGSRDAMNIKRFYLWRGSSIISQCDASRFRFSVRRGLLGLWQRRQAANQDVNKTHESTSGI